MRKLVNILLVVFYLIPVIGFSVDLHKCGKKIRVVSINASHETKCPCGSEMPFGCCKDFHVSVKLTDNQKTTSQLYIPKNNFVKQLSTIYSFSVLVPPSQVIVFDFVNYHAPPFKSKQPVYLTNSIFRI